MRTDIHTLDLDFLLDHLRENEEEVLARIDSDELLRTTEKGDLVLANASKSLFSPEEQHHLYAKGIVYQRDPYRLVSLPLLKIYNHTEKLVCDDLTYQLAEDPSVRLSFPLKEDGYMAHLFEHGDEVHAATRGSFGIYDEEMHFDYVGTIERIADEKYPALLDPAVVRDLSVICEAIHPESRIVTDYGDTEDLVVLSVFDQTQYRYWTNAEVQQWAETYELRAVDFLLREASLQEAIEAVSELNTGESSRMLEGGVLCFEKDSRIIHRVKVKCSQWCREFSFRFNCTLRTTVEMCWNKPEFEEWENVETYLIGEGLTSEETIEFYKEFHDTYLAWLQKARDRADWAISEVAKYESEFDTQKEIALAAKDSLSRDDFSLVMYFYNRRDREGLVLQALRQDEIYSGVKGLIDELRFGQ